mmetsp:Transcript_31999/g.95836  ORF Transcript_31999/g.95836 Transcript_31999/m.95836 type:complete len:577 (+) Transcript_31999:733-2463(+)
MLQFLRAVVSTEVCEEGHEAQFQIVAAIVAIPVINVKDHLDGNDARKSESRQGISAVLAVRPLDATSQHVLHRRQELHDQRTRGIAPDLEAPPPRLVVPPQRHCRRRVSRTAAIPLALRTLGVPLAPPAFPRAPGEERRAIERDVGVGGFDTAAGQFRGYVEGVDFGEHRGEGQDSDRAVPLHQGQHCCGSAGGGIGGGATREGIDSDGFPQHIHHGAPSVQRQRQVRERQSPANRCRRAPVPQDRPLRVGGGAAREQDGEQPARLARRRRSPPREGGPVLRRRGSFATNRVEVRVVVPYPLVDLPADAPDVIVEFGQPLDVQPLHLPIVAPRRQPPVRFVPCVQVNGVVCRQRRMEKRTSRLGGKGGVHHIGGRARRGDGGGSEAKRLGGGDLGGMEKAGVEETEEGRDGHRLGHGQRRRQGRQLGLRPVAPFLVVRRFFVVSFRSRDGALHQEGVLGTQRQEVHPHPLHLRPKVLDHPFPEKFLRIFPLAPLGRGPRGQEEAIPGAQIQILVIQPDGIFHVHDVDLSGTDNLQQRRLRPCGRREQTVVAGEQRQLRGARHKVAGGRGAHVPEEG